MKQDGRGGSRTHPRWSDDEIATLRACHGALSPAEVARRLPGRSPIGIVQKARMLRLAGDRPRLHQVARMMGVNDYTARRWVDAGVLPASRHQASIADWHHIRIRRGDLLDFLRDYRFLYDAPPIADPGLRAYVAALPPSRERWHTPKEAATFLRVPAATVRKWLRKGDLPGLLVGGRYWVGESALRAVRPPETPSLRGRRRGQFKGQTPEREALRARNAAATFAVARPYGERHSTSKARV